MITRNRGLAVEQVLEWRMGAEPLLVVQDGMTMEESAALTVLPGQPDRVAVFEEGGVRQVLGKAPVHRTFAESHLPAGVDDSLHAAVQLEIVVRVLAQLPAEPLDSLDRHRGIAR